MTVVKRANFSQPSSPVRIPLCISSCINYVGKYFPYWP